MTEVIFYHAPQTRSSSILALLEELGAPYRLELLNMKAGEQRNAPYLAINPMGKVPAIVHNGGVVTEQIACAIYLADAFPTAGLAPAIGDPLRGPYLRWLAFYGSSFEPACVDKALNREPGRLGMMPYGDYATTIGTVLAQLRAGPYMLGERFSAADVVWGGALGWLTSFKIVDETPEVKAYVARVQARPAIKRAHAKDRDLAQRFA